MITFIAFILFVIAPLAYCAVRNYPAHKKHKARGETNRFSDTECDITAIVVLLAVFAIFAGIWAGAYYYKAADVHNSQYVIEQLTDQRDQTAVIFKDILSNEDYMQLIDAATPDDVVYLRSNPQVSDYLLGRADRIVAMNAKLFTEQNKLLDSAREVCNYADNPMIPKVPFIGPECDLDTLANSFKES